MNLQISSNIVNGLKSNN